MVPDDKVKAALPEVEVKDKAPVVNVRPFDAVTVLVTPKVPPRLTLPVMLPVPETCSVEVGEIVPTPTLPDESMVMPEAAVPPVIKPILFALIRYSPVSVSLVKVKAGAAAVPSAKETRPVVAREVIEGESFKAIVMEDPKVISPPPVKLVPAVTVTLELVRAELGILVRVLEEPEIDLLVKVWVVSIPTRMVVAPGRVNLLAPDKIWLVVEDKVMAEKTGEEVVDTS